MRKVRFIEPKGRAGRQYNAWVSRWPLLGPILLASILEKCGYDVAVHNENLSGSVLDNGEAYGDLVSSDVVGISIMTSTAGRGYAIADRLRRDRPGITIVFGGVHATFCPQEALAHGDIVVRGEGENAIEAIAAGDIRGGIITPPPVENLDVIPTLNHWLMRDFDKLIRRARRQEYYQLPIMTSRGCPYGCMYCSVSKMFGRNVRRQSVEKACADMARYVSSGFRHFFFYDDNFTADRNWTRQLLQRLSPLNIRFNAQTRADFHWLDAERKQSDKALLAAMRDCGCDVLYIGYETVDDSTAENWHKGYRGPNALERRLSQDTAILHDYHFWIHGMFVMGPQHTQSTIDQIVCFSVQNKLESMQISVLTPFPGTPLFEQTNGNLLLRQFPEDWDYFDGAHCVYNNSVLGVEGIHRALLRAHRRFYRAAIVNRERSKLITRDILTFGDKLAMLWRQVKEVAGTIWELRRENRRYFRLVEERLCLGSTSNSPGETADVS